MIPFDRLAAALGLAALWLMPLPAAAQSGATALITDLTGTSEPAIEPFSEVPAGTTLKLAANGKIAFLFYDTCETVTIAGGTISFGDVSFEVTGGKVLEKTPSPCPRKVTLRADGTIAGVMLRSSAAARSNLKLSTQPALVLAGKAGGTFGTLQITKANAVVYEAKLHGPQFSWPKDVPALIEGQPYQLVLLPKAAGGRSMYLDFTAADPHASGVPPLTLIRVE
ncbi:MAG: hypothetical protein HY246_06295 [Proteobacteria bacterium]|nr:hypothetical protein [Pseudomonadota bacterium]